ncbi:MAG: hypothetical protein KAI94_03215 [Anaerolineales bacterium]|nr:hypothetical protein [Anaerolineales bacterium]
MPDDSLALLGAVPEHAAPVGQVRPEQVYRVATLPSQRVFEHFRCCFGKYCRDETVEQARHTYSEHTRREMSAILEARGQENASIYHFGAILRDFGPPTTPLGVAAARFLGR